MKNSIDLNLETIINAKQAMALSWGELLFMFYAFVPKPILILNKNSLI